MRITPSIAAAGLAVALIASSCSGSSSSSQTTAIAGNTGQTSVVNSVTTVSATTAPVTTPNGPTTAPAPTTNLPGAVDPNAPEVVEPGDIPDNQVFISFTPSGGVYTVKVPEGWTRTEAGGVVTFTDKFNSIALRSSAAATAPTVASVTAGGLSDVAPDATFRLIDIKPVTRKSGTGLLAVYEIGSTPNPVTGKQALLAVERYVFFHDGTLLTMTLSGAKGADNVDPWRIVSDSLTWK